MPPTEHADLKARAVENRAGAGGTIGTVEMVRARPDGLSLLLGNIGPQSIGYSLFRNLPYRAEQIAPIAGTGSMKNVTGTSSAVAIVAVSPGMAPKNSP